MNKSMKKFILLLLAVFALSSCEKDPDMDKLDNDYLVYTNYDKQTDFQSFETYYLPDSILVIGNRKETEYWKDAHAQEILAAYENCMNQKGYIRVDQRKDADLGLQVSYVKSSYYFTNYTNPYWWWDYPGYWGAPYWGNWSGCYYPYAVSYSYSTGSFIAEMLNLNVPEGKAEKLPVVWSSYMTGLLSGFSDANTRLAVRGVNQSFAQSAYLNRN